MTAESVIPVPVADGIYLGLWKSDRVSLAIGKSVFFFSVDKKVGQSGFPCLISIENKKAIVDSGNPVKIVEYA